MLELAADLRLLDEPPDHGRVPGVARVEHLHRDVAAEVGVAPLEDDAHPAAGDLAEDVVAPRPAGGEGLLGARGRPPATARRARRAAGPAT